MHQFLMMHVKKLQYGETEDYMANIVESLGMDNIQIENISIYPNPIINMLNVNIGANSDLNLFNI